MTHENNGSVATYKLMPRTAKTKMLEQKELSPNAKLLKATTLVKALKPLLFITYRFTCEKLSYYRCTTKHVLNWISGDPSNMVID